MAYDSISLGENLIIDYFMYISEEVNDDFVNNTLDRFYEPNWYDNDNIEILCEFEDNIISSYIKNLTLPLQRFDIYRQKIGDNKIYKVAEVDKNTSRIADYLVANNSEYSYMIVPVTEKYLGLSSPIDTIKTDWFDWSLTPIKQIKDNIYVPQDVWILQLDISSGAITQNINVTTQQSTGKYPKISIGENNYASGTLTCLLGNIISPTYDFNDNAELIEKWNEFVGSGSECILKDRKGMIYKVCISDNPTRQYNDTVNEQPTTITFNFIEVGDYNDITVYKTLNDGE